MRENENRLPPVDPKPDEPKAAPDEVPEDEREVELPEEPDRADERSLKRLVEPRSVPKLAAPEPMLAFIAALPAALPPPASPEEDETPVE